jgi:putative serine protease PepD
MNRDKDVALLHSDEDFPRLTPTLGVVAPGQPVVAIGAPLGLAQTVTAGVVSAIRDDVPGEANRQFVQFDAPINPGNSGGPILDAHGQVLAIATAGLRQVESINLGVPITIACDTFAELC